MIEGRKQAVSVRMSAGDLRGIKELASRLGARDSDVIRFAVKALLIRLAPLADPGSRGRDLVPALLEGGQDLLGFFELDAERLQALVNEGVSDAAERVAPEDLALLALAGLKGPYAAQKLRELNRLWGRSCSSGDLAFAIRQYLFEKYVYRGAQDAPPVTLQLVGKPPS